MKAEVTSREDFLNSFPIVGIGASAGGLKALQCFVGALPREFGFAVVFMQHLSTKHRSLLPELLHNRRPDIPIHEISAPVRILPGRIYLCPPGKEVRAEEGTFTATPLPDSRVRLPIDDFFASLAGDARERAIAVILSGAGTDGARGIQEIRDAGGSVFVQDPATAEFPAMPLAAIGTGRADRVLTPENIAQEILKLHGAVPSADRDFTPAQFEAFSRLIYEKTGHGFTHYKRSVVSRRIRRRMYLRGAPSFRDYMAILAEKDVEASAMAADLMIGVTSFFRDRLAWKALKTGVIKKFVAADENTPVRIWTPACATGEEAYSIAMMLRQEFDLSGVKREIQVFATDVNDSALEKAREGRYPGSITADVPPDYMKKFFSCSEDEFSVIIGKEIREAVVFAKQDLLTDPPFSHLDLIICRNLLIYLEAEAQEKCVALFHYALKDDGYLFLGNAESPGRESPLFKSLAHKKCRIYQKIETERPVRLSLAVPFAPDRASMPIIRALGENPQSVVEFVQQMLLEESGPPAVAVNQHCDIFYHNGPTNRYLRQPRGAPTQNLLDLLPGTLKNRIRGALYRVTQEERPVSIRTTIPVDDRKRGVTLRISKLRDNLFLVVFREKGRLPVQTEEHPGEASPVEDKVVRQLEGELAATRAELQLNIEQLKSLNEELQSSNEELQAANEELETSREELQSLNEELITVNSQLQLKIEEQEETNNDLNNFLTSTNIPTVFLDQRFRVKRFTSAMSRLIKLIPADVGRPISDMSQQNLGGDLLPDAESVLEHLRSIRREIKVGSVWYMRTVLPYRTSDNRIEGVVITYSDVSDLKQAEERTRHLASFPQMNPNPVIEVDSSGEIRFFNPATEKILGRGGMDKGDASVFLPADTDEILKNLEKEAETSLYREVTVKDRVFGETIHVSPRFNVFRIYGYDITEIRNAEQISGRIAAIVESADDAIISKNLKGVVKTWNVGAEKIFGYTAEEAIGRHISFLAPPGHRDETREILLRIEAGEHIDHFETERMRKDGSVIPVSLTFSPIKDADGRVVGASKIAHDITERKQAQEQIVRAKEQWERTFESVPDMIAIIDNDHRVVRVNASMAKRLGRSPEECVGVKCHEVVHGTTIPHSFCPHARTMKDGGEHVQEVHEERLGMDLLVTTTPLVDEQGKMIGSVHVAHDITERKRSEKALLEAKQDEERHSAQLQTVLDNLTEGLVVADMEANLFHWNPSAVAMHGFSSIEECRRKLPEFVDIFELSTAEDGVLSLERWPLARILRGEPLRDWEVQIRRRGTDWQRVFSYGGTLARDNEGRPLLAVVTVADITQRKRAEERLLALNKALKALSDSSQAIIRAEDEQGYLNSVCRIIVEDCGYPMVWIGFKENDEAKSVRPAAYAGFEDGYLETLKITWADTERGLGPTGTAVRTGNVSVCRNMLTDPAFAPWRDEAVKRGYAASIVFPLGESDKVFGAITIYSEKSDPFSGSEIKLLKELADNLSYGIEVLRMRAARQEAEESLKRSLSRFELLTVTAGELLYSTEPQEVVESVCRKVMEYLDCHAFFNFLIDERAGKLRLNAWAGIPEEEARRIEWLDFGVAVCGCAARDSQRIVAEHIPTTPDERTELVKSYGIKAYCCHPLFGPGGKVIGTLSFGTCNRETFSREDISLMKAVTDQVAVAMIRMRNEAEVLELSEDMATRNVALEAANKELESFIYSISHDLRAPLRSMAGFAKILSDDYAGRLDGEGMDYLTRIQRSSGKMNQLIDDLLRLAKISRQEMERCEVDISRKAAAFIAEMREGDPDRSVEVDIEEGLIVSADPRLIELVLSNLLGNAWKFTSKTERPHIELGSMEKEGRTVYFVRDNGAGFNPDYAEKMFLPFQRLHSEGEFEGTGIGLTIVERIIHRHGGRIWAEGETGKGSTIYFTVG